MNKVFLHFCHILLQFQTFQLKIWQKTLRKSSLVQLDFNLFLHVFPKPGFRIIDLFITNIWSIICNNLFFQVISQKSCGPSWLGWPLTRWVIGWHHRRIHSQSSRWRRRSWRNLHKIITWLWKSIVGPGWIDSQCIWTHANCLKNKSIKNINIRYSTCFVIQFYSNLIVFWTWNSYFSATKHGYITWAWISNDLIQQSLVFSDIFTVIVIACLTQNALPSKVSTVEENGKKVQ